MIVSPSSKMESTRRSDLDRLPEDIVLLLRVCTLYLVLRVPYGVAVSKVDIFC